MLLAAALAAQVVAPDPVFAPMAALYDEVCLQAFPIDGGVDALMKSKGATELTPAQVKVTLRDDPGRGWTLKVGDQSVLVILELPPYHACSVRFPIADAPVDLVAYRAVVDPFKAAHEGFAADPAYDADMQDLHVHATVDRRALPVGSESLMVIDQHVINPTRRAKGETGTMLRFVHQIKTGD